MERKTKDWPCTSDRRSTLAPLDYAMAASSVDELDFAP
jgi:hypothetical protein